MTGLVKTILYSLFFCAFIGCNYATAADGMVVSEQHLATDAGVEVLRAGGNAIDAAIAVGYALAVVNPCCGNIGGGGFMTIHLANGNNVFLNFRERAPLAATENMFHDQHTKSTQGYLAVATPGTVAGFELALKKYGSMTRTQVMTPAILLAEKGFILGAGDIKLLAPHTEEFKQQPNIAAIFLKNNQPYQVGDRLVQKELATTLKQISAKGAAAFYEGEIAAAVVAASKKNNGILSLKDFSQYRAQLLNPIICTYHHYTVISAPPPSSGGITLCEMLNILEGYPLTQLGFHSTASIEYIVAAMRQAYHDRNNQLGDPDFVKNPVEKLISKEYAAQIRNQITIDATQTTEGVNTTHYSVIDKFGNAVAVTYTLNSFFGAGIIANNTGFFLNNEMDDFTTQPGRTNQFGLVQGEKNAIQPGKRPLSSMTPTIILKDQNVVLVVGSPGGPRITTATLQTILNVLDYGLTIQDAVNAPRFHNQGLPNTIEVEPFAISSYSRVKLFAEGYRFVNHDYWGAVEAIYVDPKTRITYGANDIRRSAGKECRVD